MKKVLLAYNAYPQLREHLAERGYAIETVHPIPNLHPAMAAHPDARVCKMGAEPGAPVFFGDESVLRPEYPGDSLYNALSAGGLFVHNLTVTAPELLDFARRLGMKTVNVKQGYTKCSCAAVSDSHVITADEGIIRALNGLSLSVLRIRSGYVNLPGFEHGFIGGTSGRVGDEMVFCGGLDTHPDGDAIREFICEAGVSVWDIPGKPLLDIGTVIEYSDEV